LSLRPNDALARASRRHPADDELFRNGWIRAKAGVALGDPAISLTTHQTMDQQPLLKDKNHDVSQPRRPIQRPNFDKAAGRKGGRHALTPKLPAPTPLSGERLLQHRGIDVWGRPGWMRAELRR